MKQAILSASNLSYRRQRQLILNQCHLSLFDHEVVALIGHNGVGKTTLFHLLAGLLTPSTGHITRRVDPQSQWLGYLPDTSILYPSMRVDEFLRYCARIRGLRSVKEAVEHVVERCRLNEVLKQRCGSLSHGYQQRVGLAQAIIHKPQIILLDEPTNGLDYAHKQALRPLLAALGRQASVLTITHDYHEAIATANRVYVLREGATHEIVLPPKEGLWWVSIAQQSYDHRALNEVFDKVIDEGPFFAVKRDCTTPADIYHHLRALNINAHVDASYPVAALQASIDHVG